MEVVIHLHVWWQAPGIEKKVDLCPWGSKACGHELSTATSQFTPCGLLVLGHGLLGTTAAAVGMREQSLVTVGVLEPACQVQASRVQYSAAGTEDPNLWGAGVLGPAFRCRLSEAKTVAAGTGEQSLEGAGFLGLLAGCGLPGVQYNGAAGTEEPILLPCAFYYSPGAEGALGPRSVDFPGISW